MKVVFLTAGHSFIEATHLPHQRRTVERSACQRGVQHKRFAQPDTGGSALGLRDRLARFIHPQHIAKDRDAGTGHGFQAAHLVGQSAGKEIVIGIEKFDIGFLAGPQADIPRPTGSPAVPLQHADRIAVGR